jgi:hypothetical protein
MLGKVVFSEYGIEIIERDCKNFIRFDEGEIASKFVEYEITDADAMRAQINEDEAYAVIIKYQNERLESKGYFDK